MEKEGQVILWIPTLQYLGKERTSATLERALEARGILYKQLFFPTGVLPQGFPLGREFVLDIDEVLGFSFKRIAFSECEEINRGFYNITENTLTLGVKIVGVEEYPPDELADYLKKIWLPHPAEPVS